LRWRRGIPGDGYLACGAGRAIVGGEAAQAQAVTGWAPAASFLAGAVVALGAMVAGRLAAGAGAHPAGGHLAVALPAVAAIVLAVRRWFAARGFVPWLLAGAAAAVAAWVLAVALA